ncbi:MAG: oligopeptidase A, partial [Polyangiaceae bacterium]
MNPTDNPLLSAIAGDSLPAFDRILPEHAEPAIDAVLSNAQAQLDALLADTRDPNFSPSWERLIQPLEDMSDHVMRVWGPVSHLFGVTSTAAWRKAHAACLPKVTAHVLALSQNEDLSRAHDALAESRAFATLSPIRRKVINDARRDFKLAGIALPRAQKARFMEIALRLAELQSKFEENLIDSVQAFHKPVADEACLSGMTAQGLASAREKARRKGVEGFLLTLDFPSYDAVIRYAENRDLRREL